MECADCHKEGSKSEMVIDHIMPLSRGGSNHDPMNMRMVHRACHLKQQPWYKRLWRSIKKLAWRLIPHSHRSENMEFKGVYRYGSYQFYECRKCGWTEAL